MKEVFISSSEIAQLREKNEPTRNKNSPQEGFSYALQWLLIGINIRFWIIEAYFYQLQYIEYQYTKK